jgi:hypothetical protein
MCNNPRKSFFIFQWDVPFFSASGAKGSRSELDFLFLINGKVVSMTSDYNMGPDAIEVLFFTPSEWAKSSNGTVEMVIINYEGPLPTNMKLVVYGQVSGFEFDTNSPTTYGHHNSALGAGVGAADYL